MKPLFTSKAGPVKGNVPRCCVPLASCLSPDDRRTPYERQESAVSISYIILSRGVI